MRVSYRQIAKVLLANVPHDDGERLARVNEYIETIKAMPLKHQYTLKASYIFGSKVPVAEREDLFQTLFCHILEVLAKRETPIPDLEAFCYNAARFEWKNLYRQQKRRNEILNGGFISLNQPVKDCEGREVELHETIAGKVNWTNIRPSNFQNEINSERDCQAVLDTLPDRIKAIVLKRLDYKKDKISASEYSQLWRYLKQNGNAIRELIAQ